MFLTILDIVRERGPMTVAAFMDVALYHPDLGYYARAAQRSGRHGDFFTSVDVGAIFGELLARQVAEMAELIAPSPEPFDLVEAGAGNGRLSADILRALRERAPSLYGRTRLHLVETSGAAASVQRDTLGEVAERLASSGPDLPASSAGVLVANELIDALPVHQVVMTQDGLREAYVTADGDALRLVEGPLSSPRIAEYFGRVGVTLVPGWRAEVNLRALDWIAALGERLTRGFAILIDYGHPAAQLYSASHASGTLRSYARHRVGGSGDAADWLAAPGNQDLTAHVDFTSIEQAATAAGFTTLGLMDQTYFLLGLLGGDAARLGPATTAADVKRRLGLKTLVMPGGPGSTHKVLLLGREVGTPALIGCSSRMRLT